MSKNGYNTVDYLDTPAVLKQAGFRYDQRKDMAVDKDNNKVSLKTYSIEHAILMLNSLKYCKDTIDCYKLRDCKKCVECRDSSKLTDGFRLINCTNMRRCENCKNCDDCQDCSGLNNEAGKKRLRK